MREGDIAVLTGGCESIDSSSSPLNRAIHHGYIFKRLVFFKRCAIRNTCDGNSRSHSMLTRHAIACSPSFPTATLIAVPTNMCSPGWRSLLHCTPPPPTPTSSPLLPPTQSCSAKVWLPPGLAHTRAAVKALAGCAWLSKPLVFKVLYVALRVFYHELQFTVF